MGHFERNAFFRVVLLNPGVRFVEDGFAQSVFGLSLESHRVCSLIYLKLKRNNLETETPIGNDVKTSVKILPDIPAKRLPNHRMR